MARKKKAAFQLSLGLIVAVVFAVILLSLSITWISDLMGNIGELTHKTTDIAQQRLLDELAASGERVGIAAPAITAWEKSDTGSYALGIRNKDADRSNTYYINVYLEGVGGGLGENTITDAGFRSTINDWLSYSLAADLEAGGKKTVDLIIRPPATAVAGIYLFRVAVCENIEGGNCHATSPPVYSSPSQSLYGHAQFAIEIKSV